LEEATPLISRASRLDTTRRLNEPYSAWRVEKFPEPTVIVPDDRVLKKPFWTKMSVSTIVETWTMLMDEVRKTVLLKMMGSPETITPEASGSKRTDPIPPETSVRKVRDEKTPRLARIDETLHSEISKERIDIVEALMVETFRLSEKRVLMKAALAKRRSAVIVE
jgi:hypothetical protein